MGCPDEVKVEYELPDYNYVEGWQSKTFEHCDSYLIDKFGRLWYLDYSHPAKGNQKVTISISSEKAILKTEDMRALLKTLKEYFADDL